MRDSAASTIQDYLNKAVDRIQLDDLDQKDLQKVLENIEKADEEIQKQLENK